MLFNNKKTNEKQICEWCRICLVVGCLLATILGRAPNSELLSLVSHAWAGFGAAFGPLVVLSLTWRRMSGAGAVAGLVAGAATVIIWISMGWNSKFLGGDGVYEIIPGFIVSWIAIYLVSLATQSQGEFRAVGSA